MTAPVRRILRRIRARLRTQDGLVAGGEMLIMGGLVFLATWIVGLNAWNALTTDMAASAAAREAARTFVEHTGTTDSAAAAARRAGQDAGNAVRPASVSLDITGQLARCERITVTASITVPMLKLPFIGGWGGSMTMTDVHSELVDPYRSGLSGTVNCS